MNRLSATFNCKWPAKMVTLSNNCMRPLTPSTIMRLVLVCLLAAAATLVHCSDLKHTFSSNNNSNNNNNNHNTKHQHQQPQLKRDQADEDQHQNQNVEIKIATELNSQDASQLGALIPQDNYLWQPQEWFELAAGNGYTVANLSKQNYMQTHQQQQQQQQQHWRRLRRRHKQDQDKDHEDNEVTRPLLTGRRQISIPLSLLSNSSLVVEVVEPQLLQYHDHDAQQNQATQTGGKAIIRQRRQQQQAEAEKQLRPRHYSFDNRTIELSSNGPDSGADSGQNAGDEDDEEQGEGGGVDDDDAAAAAAIERTSQANLDAPAQNEATNKHYFSQANQSSVPLVQSTWASLLASLSFLSTPPPRTLTSNNNSRFHQSNITKNNNNNSSRQLHQKSTRQVPGGGSAGGAGGQAAAGELAAPGQHAAAAAAAYALAQAGRKAADKLNADLCKNFSIGIQHDNGGIFTSPDYPNPYPTNLVCTKLIEAPSGYYVVLEFRDQFNIEEAGNDCDNDKIEIRDGRFGYSKVLARYCGNRFPPEVRSSDEAMWLRFISDPSITHTGFKAVYRFEKQKNTKPLPPFECRFNVTSMPLLLNVNGTDNKTGIHSGIIKNTDVPEKLIEYSKQYNVSLECIWNITVTPGWKIYLTFSSYEINKPNDCDSNFIEIYEENLTEENQTVKFCGTRTEPQQSRSNVFNIRHHAIPSASGSKFEIIYTAFREKGPSGCDGREFDCDDGTCIHESLKCDGTVNCKYRYDEASEPGPCATGEDVQPFFETEHMVIILIVFLTLVSGMCASIIISCWGKIQERRRRKLEYHMRKSREASMEGQMNKVDQLYGFNGEGDPNCSGPNNNGNGNNGNGNGNNNGTNRNKKRLTAPIAPSENHIQQQQQVKYPIEPTSAYGLNGQQRLLKQQVMSQDGIKQQQQQAQQQQQQQLLNNMHYQQQQQFIGASNPSLNGRMPMGADGFVKEQERSISVYGSRPKVSDFGQIDSSLKSAAAAAAAAASVAKSQFNNNNNNNGNGNKNAHQQSALFASLAHQQSSCSSGQPQSVPNSRFSFSNNNNPTNSNSINRNPSFANRSQIGTTAATSGGGGGGLGSALASGDSSRIPVDASLDRDSEQNQMLNSLVRNQLVQQQQQQQHQKQQQYIASAMYTQQSDSQDSSSNAALVQRSIATTGGGGGSGRYYVSSLASANIPTIAQAAAAAAAAAGAAQMPIQTSGNSSTMPKFKQQLSTDKQQLIFDSQQQQQQQQRCQQQQLLKNSIYQQQRALTLSTTHQRPATAMNANNSMTLSDTRHQQQQQQQQLFGNQMLANIYGVHQAAGHSLADNHLSSSVTCCNSLGATTDYHLFDNSETPLISDLMNRANLMKLQKQHTLQQQQQQQQQAGVRIPIQQQQQQLQLQLQQNQRQLGGVMTLQHRMHQQLQQHNNNNSNNISGQNSSLPMQSNATTIPRSISAYQLSKAQLRQNQQFLQQHQQMQQQQQQQQQQQSLQRSMQQQQQLIHQHQQQHQLPHKSMSDAGRANKHQPAPPSHSFSYPLACQTTDQEDSMGVSESPALPPPPPPPNLIQVRSQTSCSVGAAANNSNLINSNVASNSNNNNNNNNSDDDDNHNDDNDDDCNPIGAGTDNKRAAFKVSRLEQSQLTGDTLPDSDLLLANMQSDDVSTESDATFGMLIDSVGNASMNFGAGVAPGGPIRAGAQQHQLHSINLTKQQQQQQQQRFHQSSINQASLQQQLQLQQQQRQLQHPLVIGQAMKGSGQQQFNQLQPANYVTHLGECNLVRRHQQRAETLSGGGGGGSVVASSGGVARQQMLASSQPLICDCGALEHANEIQRQLAIGKQQQQQQQQQRQQLAHHHHQQHHLLQSSDTRDFDIDSETAAAMQAGGGGVGGPLSIAPFAYSSDLNDSEVILAHRGAAQQHDSGALYGALQHQQQQQQPQQQSMRFDRFRQQSSELTADDDYEDDEEVCDDDDDNDDDDEYDDDGNNNEDDDDDDDDEFGNNSGLANGGVALDGYNNLSKLADSDASKRGASRPTTLVAAGATLRRQQEKVRLVDGEPDLNKQRHLSGSRASLSQQSCTCGSQSKLNIQNQNEQEDDEEDDDDDGGGGDANSDEQNRIALGSKLNCDQQAPLKQGKFLNNYLKNNNNNNNNNCANKSEQQQQQPSGVLAKSAQIADADRVEAASTSNSSGGGGGGQSSGQQQQGATAAAGQD